MSERKWLLVGLTLVGVAALWWGVQVTRRTSEQLTRTPTENLTLRFFRDPKPDPVIHAQTISGRTLSSEAWRGKVVLVNFWATWCSPCREEIPALVALQARYGDWLQVVGISMDEGSPADVKQYAESQRINYPIVIATPDIERAFGNVYALPTTFVLDRESRIVQKHVGMLNPSRTDQETRALAGLDIAATIERVDERQPLPLSGNAQATDIPGLDLSALSAPQKATVLQRLNTDSCTCGCGLTLAQCRLDDPACDVSLPLAKKAIDAVRAGR